MKKLLKKHRRLFAFLLVFAMVLSVLRLESFRSYSAPEQEEQELAEDAGEGPGAEGDIIAGNLNEEAKEPSVDGDLSLHRMVEFTQMRMSQQVAEAA